MIAVSNTKLIKNRTTWSGRLMLAGFGMIIGSAALTFLNPAEAQYILPAYGLLFGGFIVFNIGASLASKWRRPPRPDQALERALKGIDNRHRLYNYLLPSEHVLLTPFGVTVFQVRRLPGEIACTGSLWTHKRSLWSRLRFAAEEQVGNPTRDVQNDIRLLREFIGRNVGDKDVPIEGLILFAHPQVNLTLNEPDVPVLTPKEAKNHMRQALAKQPRLKAESYHALADLFDAAENAEEVEAATEPEPATPKKPAARSTSKGGKPKA